MCIENAFALIGAMCLSLIPFLKEGFIRKAD